MKCLLAVGACYLDTILDVDHYPAEDEKLRASSILKRRGGNCPNTLEILQQLLDTDTSIPTISLALLAVLPSRSSPAYQEISASFNASTDLAHCICRPDVNEPASSYIVRSRQVDSRTIINYNGLPEMTTAEFASVADKLGENTGWCHFEGNGYESSEECLRAQATLVSKASLLLCTWGDAGVGALELPSLTYRECRAFKTAGTDTVDTVGAGDTFIAGMLFALTCRGDWDLDRKLRFGNELAGRKVVQEGLRGLGSLMQHAL
ncbi:hypothetical protein XPA_008377 [Xanthoria parietina]